jgi:hypothetical protein
MGDVIAGDHEVGSAVVLATLHDVAVGVAGIEVIGRDPVEPGAEVGFHLPHQVADERFEVGDFGRILRRHDETKLVAVALASLGERLGIGSIVALVIEFAGIALAR